MTNENKAQVKKIKYPSGQQPTEIILTFTHYYNVIVEKDPTRSSEIR